LALYPVLMTLSQWGDDWLDDGNGPPEQYRHSRCGEITRSVLSCDQCGEVLRPEEVSMQPGTVLTAYLDDLAERGQDIPSDGEVARDAAQFWRDNGRE
jgi:hypothetical protein